MRERIPLFIAIIFGAIAVFLIYQYLQSQKRSFTPVSIVRAAIDIGEGDILQPRHLKTDTIDREFVVPGMLYESDKDTLLGKKVNAAIRADQPIFTNQIVVEAIVVPDLPPQIEKNMRAITIPVNELASVSQLVKPGDHVDVLVNYEIPYIRETEVEVPNTGRFKVGQKETEPATIYLLQDVLVLAVGRTILTDEKYADPGNRGYRGVTLHVSPAEARALAFANKNASEGYSLSLRNPEDGGILDDYQVASYKTVLDIAKLQELLDNRKQFRAVLYEGGTER